MRGMSVLASLVVWCFVSVPGDWPEVRQNVHLTACQPMPGAMRTARECDAKFDLGRSQPPLTMARGANDPAALAIVSGTLDSYESSSKLLSTSHPADLNFTRATLVEDFDDDGVKSHMRHPAVTCVASQRPRDLVGGLFRWTRFWIIPQTCGKPDK